MVDPLEAENQPVQDPCLVERLENHRNVPREEALVAQEGCHRDGLPISAHPMRSHHQRQLPLLVASPPQPSHGLPDLSASSRGVFLPPANRSQARPGLW